MSKDAEEFIVDLREKAANCNNAVDLYEDEIKNLKSKKINLASRPNLLEILDSFEANELNHLINLLEHLVREKKSLSSTILSSIDADKFEVLRSVYSENFLAKAERSRAWVLFWHKTIRWVFGVSAALLIYSCAVYLSIEFDFIKVPVRDLITSSAKQ
jgi:hypothetical protein